MLVIVSDPIYNGAGEHGAQYHRAIKYTECLRSRTSLCQPFDRQNKDRKYYSYCEGHKSQNHKVELSTIVDENEEEFR